MNFRIWTRLNLMLCDTPQEAFILLCERGNLNLLTDLYNGFKHQIKVSCDTDRAFRTACDNGHFKVVKWLKQIEPRINIKAEYNYALNTACLNNYTDLIKWLHEFYKNCPLYVCSSFSSTIDHNNMDLAKWLYSQDDIKYILCGSYTYAACNNNHDYFIRFLCSDYINIDFGKWIITLYCADTIRHLINHMYKINNLILLEYTVLYHDIHEMKIDAIYQDKFDVALGEIYNVFNKTKSAKKI